MRQRSGSGAQHHTGNHGPHLATDYRRGPDHIVHHRCCSDDNHRRGAVYDHVVDYNDINAAGYDVSRRSGAARRGGGIRRRGRGL